MTGWFRISTIMLLQSFSCSSAMNGFACVTYPEVNASLVIYLDPIATHFTPG